MRLSEMPHLRCMTLGLLAGAFTWALDAWVRMSQP